jgi:hypothetical protein
LEYLESLIQHQSFARLGLKTTICFIILSNGFEIVGTSACVDPANFNQEIGEKIARDDAINKLWSLEGYLLQQKLN